ncbi:MAG TPA: O-antigen ligase family protein [Labilithrix sp.]
MNVNRPPFPKIQTPRDIEMLAQRVGMKYGAFGSRPPEEEADERVLADSFFRPTVQIIAGVFVASLLAFFLQAPTFDVDGWANKPRLDTALILFWGPALFWAMARQRLWKSLRVYLVLCLFIESFSEAMFREMGEGGYWDTVMWPSAVAWFGTLKEFAGVPGASLSTFFFVTVGLLYRAVWGKKPDTWTAPPKFATRAMHVFLVTILVLAIVGVVRGGQIDWTFRQTIHLLQLPLVAILFLYALRVPEDLAAVGTAFVTAAVVRSVLVGFVYFAICMPAGITSLPGKPEWCTNHSDTVLFVTALMILLAHALEQRKRRVTWRALGLSAIILAGVVLNNRRLAFVSLAAASLIVYLALKPSKRKRRVTVAIAVLVPLLAGYVLIGSDIPSQSAFLKPAKIIVSVLEQKDASALSRDIENENLIYTLRQAPAYVFTTGFGHEYQFAPEHPPVDLGETFRNFRLIAHNGVLWIWSVAGVVGFTLLWIVYPLGGTLAVRGYRAAQSPLERTAALGALGAIVVCVSQIWGDQGFNSYMTLITFSVAFAIAARLAVRPQGVYAQQETNA